MSFSHETGFTSQDNQGQPLLLGGEEGKQNAWTSQLMKQIKDLKDQCKGYMWVHRENSIYLLDIYEWMMVMSFSMSFLDTAIKSFFPLTIIYIRILSISLSFLSGLFGFYIKNKQFTEEAERHKQASSKFSGIASNIARQLSVPVFLRENGRDFHRNIMLQFDTLNATAPDIDPEIFEDYRMKFAHRRKVHPIEVADLDQQESSDDVEKGHSESENDIEMVHSNQPKNSTTDIEENKEHHENKENNEKNNSNKKNVKEAIDKEATDKERNKKETATKETATKETATKETAIKETAIKETDIKETAIKETETDSEETDSNEIDNTEADDEELSSGIDEDDIKVREKSKNMVIESVEDKTAKGRKKLIEYQRQRFDNNINNSILNMCLSTSPNKNVFEHFSSFNNLSDSDKE